MLSRAEIYKNNAAECEREALRASMRSKYFIDADNDESRVSLPKTSEDRADHVFPNAELVVPELDEQFWLRSDPSKIDNEYQRVDAERAQKAAAPYSGRIRTISGGEVGPGVTIVPLPGHTPGHSGYMIHGGGKTPFLWGDIVHLPTFQPARPDAGLLFDVDLPLARETRKQMFERAIADKLEVGGGHLLAPGFARVERAGQVYKIVPSRQ